MNTDDPVDTGYFSPTTIDKPLPRTRPGHWASQPQKDHPRGRPTFRCVSNPAPLELTSRWNPTRRLFDTAMTWVPAALVVIAAAGVYLVFFR